MKDGVLLIRAEAGFCRHKLGDKQVVSFQPCERAEASSSRLDSLKSDVQRRLSRQNAVR